jgi:hypothetical protein
MNLENRTAIIDKFTQERHALMQLKGHDYARDKDVNSNFRLIATVMEGVPITPLSVAMVFKLKGLFAIIERLKGKVLKVEDTRSRYADDANYTDLMVALEVEANPQPIFFVGDNGEPNMWHENEILMSVSGKDTL